MKWLVICAALFLAVFASVCQAQLVTNGSFELGNYSDNGFGYMPSVVGSTTIQGWTANNVDWINTLWTAAAGSKSLDLNGNAAGSISQVITTVPGTDYELSFALAGNPVRDDGFPTNKTLNVLIGGVPTGLSFEAQGNSSTAMDWVQEILHFTASGSTTLLEFVSTTSGASGPAIDSVKVETVGGVVPTPEPSILYLLTCGLTGLLVVRRRGNF